MITLVLPTVSSLLQKASMRVHLPGREDQASHACLPVIQKKGDEDEEALDTNQDKNFKHKDNNCLSKNFMTNPSKRDLSRDREQQVWKRYKRSSISQGRNYLPNSLLELYYPVSIPSLNTFTLLANRK